MNLWRPACRKAHRPHTRRSDTDEGIAPERLSPRHLPDVKLLPAGSAGRQPPPSTGSLRPQALPPAPPHGAPPPPSRPPPPDRPEPGGAAGPAALKRPATAGELRHHGLRRCATPAARCVPAGAVGSPETAPAARPLPPRRCRPGTAGATAPFWLRESPIAAPGRSIAHRKRGRAPLPAIASGRQRYRRSAPAPAVSGRSFPRGPPHRSAPTGRSAGSGAREWQEGRLPVTPCSAARLLSWLPVVGGGGGGRKGEHWNAVAVAMRSGGRLAERRRQRWSASSDPRGEAGLPCPIRSPAVPSGESAGCLQVACETLQQNCVGTSGRSLKAPCAYVRGWLRK